LTFSNYENEYANDMKKYSSKEEIQALDTLVSSARLTKENYEVDNTFLDVSFGLTLHNLRCQDCYLIGVSRAPWPHSNQDCAIVYENVDTYEIKWCHISYKILDWWREQINLYQQKGI
jgi:hypothetical protein